MKIAVIGAGYVGLISAVVFAEQGHDLTVVDYDIQKIAKLSQNKVPFYEPGLTEELLTKTKINYASGYDSIPDDVDIVMLAVGTPANDIDYSTDLTAIKQAAISLKRRFKDATSHPLYVIKSTVPPGTSKIVADILDCSVVSNPEFLREGHALEDARNPDRTVLGYDAWIPSEREAQLFELYNHRNIMSVSNETAELAKYASNAFLALKVSYINQISDLCERAGGDIGHVAMIMGADDRIGTKFLKVGPGYGGSCFPKDVHSLIRTARDHDRPLTIVESLASMNEERKIQMARRICAIAKEEFDSDEPPHILFYGTTFKEGTDDMRGAASLTIVPLVRREYSKITIFEPNDAIARTCKEFRGCAWISEEDLNATHFDMIVMMNAPTKNVHFGEEVGLFGEVVVDLRNCLDQKMVENATAVYIGLGNGSG